MFLACFGFHCGIMEKYLNFLFNLPLDNTTSVTWGWLFVAIIFVLIILRLLFTGVFGSEEDDIYDLKYKVEGYEPKHRYTPRHSMKGNYQAKHGYRPTYSNSRETRNR